jgi:hypothetical protein
MTQYPTLPQTEPAEHKRRERLLEARPMEEAIAGEAARPPEEMNATTLLMDRRTSAKEEETLAKVSVEEDRQGMVANLPSASKTAVNKSR